MIAVGFLMDAAFNCFREARLQIFPRVSAVGVQNLVTLIHELRQGFAVMNAGTGDDVVRDEFAVRVGLHVVLVAIMGLVALLRPPGIGVLLAQLVDIFFGFPFLRYVAVLDAGVFFPGVALARGVHEGRVDDGASVGYEVGIGELLVEGVEQFPDNIGFGESVAEGPDSLGIGDAVVNVHPQETHEGDAVVDLEFSLVVAEVVDSLKDENLEHEDAVIGRTSAGALGFFAASFVKDGPEDFPLDDFVEANEGVTQLAEFFQAVFFVKEAHLHGSSLHSI